MICPKCYKTGMTWDDKTQSWYCPGCYYEISQEEWEEIQWKEQKNEKQLTL